LPVARVSGSQEEKKRFVTAGVELYFERQPGGCGQVDRGGRDVLSESTAEGERAGSHKGRKSGLTGEGNLSTAAMAGCV